MESVTDALQFIAVPALRWCSDVCWDWNCGLIVIENVR